MIDKPTTIEQDNAIAEDILSEHRIFFCGGGYYEYIGGVYRPLEKYTLKGYIRKELKKTFSLKRAEEIIHTINTMKFRDPETLNLRESVNLKNGILNLETKEATHHTPENISTIQLGVSYKPGSECPRWVKALDEIFE